MRNGAPRPLSSADRLKDDIYLALQLGGPWPTRLSTAPGALASLVALARQRQLPAKSRNAAIGKALAWYLESDSTLGGDTRHDCGQWFFRGWIDDSSVERMIKDGFAVHCPDCAGDTEPDLGRGPA